MTNIRTVMGSMDLDELLSHRDEINHRLLQVVDAARILGASRSPASRSRTSIRRATWSNSMGRQMKAEREKRATILEAEGKRQSAILNAEGEKQAQMLEAEGRREAAFRDAEARERSAEAEAKATQVVSRRHRHRQRAGDQLFRRQQLHRRAEGAGQVAEPESADAAARSRPRSSARSPASPRSPARRSAAAAIRPRSLSQPAPRARLGSLGLTGRQLDGNAR